MFYLKDNNNPTSVILIKRVNGKTIKYYTGISIDPEDWNKDINKPISRRGEKGKKLSLISSKLSQIEIFVNKYLDDLHYNNYDGSAEDLKQKLTDRFKANKKTSKLSFYDSYKLFLKYVENNKSNGTYRQHKATKASIYKFDKKLTFDKVNYSFYEKYLEFLFNQKKTDNTVGSRIVKLKTFLNWSLKNGHHSNNTFLDFKSMSRDVDAVYLNWDELKAMKALKLTGLKDKVRDLFLIGVLSGQRYSDYSIFNRSDLQDGFIVKRAKKTFERSYIPLNKDSLPYLIELLSKYDWNLPKIDQSVFNLQIKEVGRLAKINTHFKKLSKSGSVVTESTKPKFKFISSHTARRTFITISLNKGINPLIVMRQAGINKLDTLKKYYKFDKQEMINQIGSVWKEF